MSTIPMCFFRERERGRAAGQRSDAGCKSAYFTYLNTAGSVPHFTNAHIHLVSVCVCTCVLVMLRTGVKLYTFQLFWSSWHLLQHAYALSTVAVAHGWFWQTVNELNSLLL